MSFSEQHHPPFSPILLLGLAAKPLPLIPINRILAQLIAVMHRRHSDVFARMTTVASPVFRINATDIPFDLILDANPIKPALTATRDATIDTAATISGPLLTLMALLEGQIDGDALFFTRQLIIKGDTEAVLALRNAVDGSDIDLMQDLSSIFGPAAPMATRLAALGNRVFSRAATDMETIATSLTTKLTRAIDSNSDRLSDVEQSVSKIQKQLRRRSSVDKNSRQGQAAP